MNGQALGVQNRVKVKEEIEDKVLSYFGVEDPYIPDWSLVKDDPLVFVSAVITGMRS